MRITLPEHILYKTESSIDVFHSLLMGGGVDNPLDHTFYLFDCAIAILLTKWSVKKQCEKATMMYCNCINI